jgi:hypothetical protein
VSSERHVRQESHGALRGWTAGGREGGGHLREASTVISRGIEVWPTWPVHACDLLPSLLLAGDSTADGLFEVNVQFAQPTLPNIIPSPGEFYDNTMGRSSGRSRVYAYCLLTSEARSRSRARVSQAPRSFQTEAATNRDGMTTAGDRDALNPLFMTVKC